MRYGLRNGCRCFDGGEMMDELIKANYIADLKSIGRKDKLLSITAKAGDKTPENSV